MRVVRDAEHLATGTGFSSRAMRTAYAATVQVGNKLDDGTFVTWVRSLHIRPNLRRFSCRPNPKMPRVCGQPWTRSHARVRLYGPRCQRCRFRPTGISENAQRRTLFGKAVRHNLS